MNDLKYILFSPTEEKVLRILGKKKMTVTDIAVELYKSDKKPINPNNVVSGAIRHINRKCEYHHLAWFINGAGLGRGGKTVWKDKN